MNKSTAAVIMLVGAALALIGGIVDDSVWGYVAAASLVLGGVLMFVSGRSAGDDA